MKYLLRIAPLILLCAALMPASVFAGDTAEVSINLFSFNPKVIEVPVGTTVTWTNGDVAFFERATGRKILWNRVASGTEVIEKLGEEHVRTGRWRVRLGLLHGGADVVVQVHRAGGVSVLLQAARVHDRDG